MLTDELRWFIRENALIAPGDRITCAVSGGADSMCMLRALCKLRSILQIELFCAHYNHGLRDTADRDEAFVRAFCEQSGIPFFSEKGNVTDNKLPGESLELAARRLRYDFLRRVSGDGKIATAHTADDNLETVLLRLCRGTSPRGLGGIPVRQGNIIRPILFAEREKILRFLAEEGIEYCEDETNALDFCPRNRVRHHVVPLLREENPAVAQSVLSLSKTLREEDALLSRLAKEALDGCRTDGGWSCERLNALDPALRRRALFAILQESGLETPAQAHLELLSGLAASSDPSARADFPGFTMERRYDTLCAPADPRHDPRRRLEDHLLPAPHYRKNPQLPQRVHPALSHDRYRSAASQPSAGRYHAALRRQPQPQAADDRPEDPRRHARRRTCPAGRGIYCRRCADRRGRPIPCRSRRARR